ncbi:hypothetical protein TrLO_g14624 [Triparma laevis f. longispina]|uniref:Origin recognition complex subunit 3 winged helix C-terminal domain-containing protein n=1 Tax=Triparma laevis f. longispina TaxID=1714387 RepID=A0A9W7KWK1_9STRA|nr:hypothetical protein TrLO_g14624 [Triparma laevis f. longispina]
MSSNINTRLAKTTLPKWLKVIPAASSASSKLLHATSFSDPSSVPTGIETSAYEDAQSQLIGSSSTQAPVAFQSSMDEERSTRNRASDYSRTLIMDAYRSLVTGSVESSRSADRQEGEGATSLQEAFRARHGRRTPAYQETLNSNTSRSSSQKSLNLTGVGPNPLIRSNSLNSTGSRGAKRRLDTMQEEDTASTTSSATQSTATSVNRPQHVEKNEPRPPTLPSIPAAIVRLGGADLEDRAELADGLVLEFENVKFKNPISRVPILCVIRGRETSSTLGNRGQLTLKMVMNNILKHCIEGAATLSPGLKQIWQGFKVNPNSPLWMEALQKWYAQVLHSSNRPVKIVVTFTAFEALPPSLASDVLCALTSLASSEIMRMPISIVIVLSKATVPAFPLVLKPEATVALKVKTFRAPKIDRLLDTLVEQLLTHPIESLPVIMSGSVLGLLKETYTDLSKSLIGFVRNLLFALDCHFTKTGSYLTVLHREEYTRNYTQLCARTLDHIRHQDDFRSFLRVTALPKIAQLKTYLQTSLEKRLTFQSAFSCLIRAAKISGLGILEDCDNKHLPVLTLYEHMEQRSDAFRRYLNDLCNKLKVLRLRELIPLLIDFMDILKGFKEAAKRACSSSTASVFGIDGVYGNLGRVFEEVGEFVILCGAAEKMENSDPKTKELVDVLFRDVADWFGCLVDRASSSWKGVSESSSSKNSKGKKNNSTTRENETKDSDRLHHLITFGDVNQLKKLILSTPRRSVTTALSKPHTFLKCECCSKKGGVCSTMEDTCVAYKLMMEFGKNVNGKEWLQKFTSVFVVSGSSEEKTESGKKKSKKTGKGNKNDIASRFMTSVTELIELNLIRKVSNRDKYERCTLVWCR